MTPSTKPMLAMFEPIAFPTASKLLPSCEAIIATTISGAEVPNETTVKPITSLGIPKFVAVEAAPDRKRSADQTRPTNPTLITKRFNVIRQIDEIEEQKRSREFLRIL